MVVVWIKMNRYEFTTWRELECFMGEYGIESSEVEIGEGEQP